jgi:hypothetical protein
MRYNKVVLKNDHKINGKLIPKGYIVLVKNNNKELNK